MAAVGTVESVWRYPVKSMRGEELETVFVGTSGVEGDRLFAFHSSAARPDFPYFTARQQHEMLRYRPRFRASANAFADVETPAGETLAIDDPALIDRLRSGAGPEHHVTLLRSDRAFADAYPVSIISLQTVRKLGDETGTAPEKRRFRANIYLDLLDGVAFAEDDFVGRSLRIGGRLTVSVVQRDTRCKMITLHPDTAEPTPALLKKVGQLRGGAAGIYANVLVEGMVRKGDSVELLD